MAGKAQRDITWNGRKGSPICQGCPVRGRKRLFLAGGEPYMQEKGQY
ncbi:hypothetical protein V1226_15515 [Lachnospiraceae bacterium JLR.KK009]|nr:hypothetical protein [Lachnospiraceae bacterium]MCI8883339.1 hypothetical protein [Lachnospiraceae bacterium]